MAAGSEVRVYVGLGSNLSDPVSQINVAIEDLAMLPESHLISRSSLYQSVPLGPQNQPDFINAVAALDTVLTPYELLRQLQAIEVRRGRLRGVERWGPRTLDLDLLIYGETSMNDEILTLPHPGLPERNFVLYPLYEIAPDLEVVGWGRLTQLISCCSPEGLQVLQV